MDYSGVLSIVAIIIAFLTLCGDLYIGRKSIGLSTYQKITQMFNDINQPFLKHPALRPYFYDNQIFKK